jgi:predicted O-methyltransferase YrrM
MAAGLLGAQRRRDFSSPDSQVPLAKSDAERRILGVLSEAKRTGEVRWEVPVRVGRMLRVLTECTGAKRVAEIGTSTGYSGLWFLLALQRTGGTLTTFEIDHGRAEMARTHFARAGVDHLVTLIEGDAHRNVRQLRDPLDIAFLDADKAGYVDYLNQLLPLVRPGGLVLADNLGMAEAYERAVTGNAELETLVMDGEFAITLKKR